MLASLPCIFGSAISRKTSRLKDLTQHPTHLQLYRRPPFSPGECKVIYFLSLPGHTHRCLFVYISNYWQSQPLVINSLHIKQDKYTVLCRWGMTNSCSSTLHMVTSKAPPGADSCHSVRTLSQGVKVTARKDSFRVQTLLPLVMVTTVTVGLTWFCVT